MSNHLEQLDEKIAAFKKAKEALEDIGDSITEFTYDNRKVLRKEALEELHQKLKEAYGEEHADRQMKTVSRLQEVQFCSDCGNRNLGYCHCQADY